MKNILAAFQFLTIIPVHIKGHLSNKDLATSSIYFPLVGFFQGALLTLLSVILVRFFPPGVASLCIILAYLLMNGGFHLDGLSDSFDAISVKSSGDDAKDRQKRLEVMKDPASGPIGIAAIGLSMLFKYTLLMETLSIPAFVFFNPVVFLMPVLSKWSVTMAICGAKSARGDGLGKIFFDSVKTKHAILASSFTACFVYIIYFLSDFLLPAGVPGGLKDFSFFIFIAASACLCTVYAMRHLFTLRFGGITGDNLGAIHEVSETVLLITALFWQ